MGIDADEETQLLIVSQGSESSFIKRTGTIWSAMAHIITGVIGAGVLSLAWSTAQLGWIAGPLSMIIFAAITLLSTNLLCDCYRSPDSQTGPTRIPSFLEAVEFYLGKTSRTICSIVFHESLYGNGVAYIITAASSVRAIEESNCYHREGHDATCNYGDTYYMMMFGAVQIVMSQIPDFHNMTWLSVTAAIMSFSYSTIGLGLGVAKVIENGKIKGSIAGEGTSSLYVKLFLIFEAIGDIAFAYPYSSILLEIQDTLKTPPPENQTMKKASSGAIYTTTMFYLCCGCFGYAAFGSVTPGNLLTGFGFYEPYWLIDFANACIIVHLIGGFQVFSQPLFAFAERWFTEKYPENGFVNNWYVVKLPLFLPELKLNLLRLCYRSGYVVVATGIAMLFPYFNQVLGMLGGLNFWPLAIYYPVEMYIVQRKIRPWTRKWLLLQIFSILCFIVSILAVIGSVYGLINAKLG
ncbi:probable amino acid permease 7 [Impatiens glandulifera]|uniref:probable amino acid permease 7 n=1 Tax=Impatiens glandulifera TaxID=253017 RepID=UPI001FB0DED8|nr:probable amino acid permease 7 [Impatiens glandulifera]